ncbi:ArsB/NhaD family transporter, partial [Bacillus altitudinis]
MIKGRGKGVGMFIYLRLLGGVVGGFFGNDGAGVMLR